MKLGLYETQLLPHKLAIRQTTQSVASLRMLKTAAPLLASSMGSVRGGKNVSPKL